ncbi:hypothetical protein OSB04_021764 [Centaurea solstitialis]|uniref:26S proteasome non-ATPase regulatory subunit 10 n=1 Tax=Centaurea solstitialis TaxID=347529 RepID=A0AA38T641_9ASTR|nr:hypothetical protein OSB04_021764 [Centaurea solstitialis]
MEIDPPNSSADQTVKINDDELFKAADAGDVSVFKSLSQPQLIRSLALRNEDGRSLLHVAVSSARLEVVKILSAFDQSVSGINSADEEGWAPLHSAASSGNVEIVKILLDRGADVNLKNDGGRTALHYAASKGWVKVAEVLLSNSAKINMKDKACWMHPLAPCGKYRKSELCELLIEEGADIDAVDRAGQTPIMSAVICHNKEVALLLIRHGADIDVEDKEGYTVLGRASAEFRPILIDAAKAMLEG